MARQRTIKISILAAFVLLIVALMVLSNVAAPAQQAGVGESERPPAVAEPPNLTAGAPAKDYPGPSGGGDIRRVSQRQNERLGTPSTSLFLPAVTYRSGGQFAGSVVVADVNGDGKPDAVVSNNNSSTVGVLLGKGDGTFQAPVTHGSGGSGVRSVVVADVNGDGKPDAVAPNANSNTVGVLLGNGLGTFQPAVSYSSGGSSPTSVAVADLNGDGRLDIVVANESDNTLGVLLGRGDGTFQPAVAYGSGSHSFTYDLVIADVNGDGKPDLIVADECTDHPTCNSGAVGVLLGNGDGTFQAAAIYPSGGVGSISGARSVAVADVNGDGRPDVLVANYFSGTVGVLLGNGDGTFRAPVDYNVGFTVVRSVAVADVDGDGLPDLLVSGDIDSGTVQQGEVGYLLGNGDGTFQPVVSYGSGGNAAPSVTAADVNGDGQPDLLVANAEGNTIGVLLHSSQDLTTTTLVSSVNPSVVGQAVTFTATVSSTTGTPPNGEVITFKNGSAVLGTATLSGGMASLTTSSLPAGIFTITANYPGDSAFVASTSPGLRQVVNSTTKSATATTLVSSLNPSVYGQKVTWTATVTTSGSVPPTGNVSFKWNGNSIGSATLNASGVATLTRSNLNADTYPLTAVYAGDASNLGSTSAVVNQVVTQAISSAKLTSSPNPSTSGQAVIFTATITSSTVRPTGPVTFAVGKTVLGTAQLSGGKATFTTSTLAVGSTAVTATYYGNSNVAKSSASVTQTVQ
jgi:hypothetical protein